MDDSNRNGSKCRYSYMESLEVYVSLTHLPGSMICELRSDSEVYSTKGIR